MLHSMVLAASHLSLARDLLEHYGYIALFLSLVIEYLIFFIPGETFLIMAAAYTATGRMSLPFVILAAAAGAAVGANNAYWIGRMGGRRFITSQSQRFRVSPKAIVRLERFFERHGAKAVFWLRFVTVLRILVGYFSGVHELRFGLFTFFNVLGAVAWAIVIGLLGYLFAHNLAALRHLLTDTGLIVLAAVVVIGVVAWTRRERTA